MFVRLMKSWDETHSKAEHCRILQTDYHKAMDVNNELKSVFRLASALYSMLTANVMYQCAE